MIGVNVLPQFIYNIEEKRRQIIKKNTLTPNNYHLEVLDESIELFKQGCKFMPVVGASAVVESCLLAEKRRNGQHDTIKGCFDDFETLHNLIKKNVGSKIIPISELLDEEEKLDQIKTGAQLKFVNLRNKFAHWDILKLTGHPFDFYSFLPSPNELHRKYNIDFQGDFPIRFDLPGYVQLSKCLNFLIKWQENIDKRN